jgi:hypothetical protein
LAFQDLEVVAVIRLSRRVAFVDRVRDVLTNRSFPFAVRRPPGETILFPWRADDPLGVLVDLRAIVLLNRVFLLRFDKAMTDLNRVLCMANS